MVLLVIVCFINEELVYIKFYVDFWYFYIYDYVLDMMCFKFDFF